MHDHGNLLELEETENTIIVEILTRQVLCLENALTYYETYLSVSQHFGSMLICILCRFYL